MIWTFKGIFSLSNTSMRIWNWLSKPDCLVFNEMRLHCPLVTTHTWRSDSSVTWLRTWLGRNFWFDTWYTFIPLGRDEVKAARWNSLWPENTIITSIPIGYVQYKLLHGGKREKKNSKIRYMILGRKLFVYNLAMFLNLIT